MRRGLLRRTIPTSGPTREASVPGAHSRAGRTGRRHAAELLSVAVPRGPHAQAFPTFGSERTGAPVVAFCRIDDAPIRLREPIAEPDAVIVQDPTLLHQVDLFGGAPAETATCSSTPSHGFDELGLGDLVERFRPERARHRSGDRASPASTSGRPLPNAALLGALRRADAGRLAGLARSPTAIRERFPGRVGEENVAAAEAALRRVVPAARSESWRRCVARSRAPSPSRERSRSAAPR